MAGVKKDQLRWSDNDRTRVQHTTHFLLTAADEAVCLQSIFVGRKANDTVKHDQLLTYGRIYREFADKRWIGCAGARCRSLRAKTRFGDSQERKTRVLRLKAGPLVKPKMKVRQLQEIE